MSGVPLYISFGANAKKMLTWQFDTAKWVYFFFLFFFFFFFFFYKENQPFNFKQKCLNVVVRSGLIKIIAIQFVITSFSKSNVTHLRA